LLSAPKGQWEPFECTIESPPSAFILSLRDKTCAWDGNDFGVDEISLVPE
jgi:hypothetical protein